MNFSHAVVWIDHLRAHVIRFSLEHSEATEIHAPGGATHLHHKHGEVGPGHAPENQKFYASVAAALKGIAEILITGPASAKNELVKHIETHDHMLAKALAGVETSDHPTEGQLLAHARKWFDREDRMRGRNGLR